MATFTEAAPGMLRATLFGTGGVLALVGGGVGYYLGRKQNPVIATTLGAITGLVVGFFLPIAPSSSSSASASSSTKTAGLGAVYLHPQQEFMWRT